jgi:hypothetical protein
MANIQAVGTLDDWGVQVQENGVGDFNSIHLYSVSGSPLTIPGMNGFNNGIWTYQYNQTDATIVTAATPVTDVTFNVNLLDPAIANTVLYFYADLNGTFVDRASATYDGSNWSFVPNGAPVVPPSLATPDGGTTLSLLGLALVGLAGLRRKLSL